MYHLPSSPVKIDRVSCSFRYSAFSYAQRPDAPLTSRQREIADYDIQVHPDETRAVRDWILGELKCHEFSRLTLLNKIDIDVKPSQIYE